MTGQTIGHQIAEQTAEPLADTDFVDDAEVDENHNGPFVRVFVRDSIAESKMYDRIDDYPCYIDVVNQ